MVIGVDRFRAHFAGHEHQYVLIGGAACELIMDEVGLDFRATKDLDIVLVGGDAQVGRPRKGRFGVRAVRHEYIRRLLV